jgi:hypothetical protein
MSVFAVSPCFLELRRERALPAWVRGPVLFLRLLCSPLAACSLPWLVLVFLFIGNEINRVLYYKFLELTGHPGLLLEG